MPAINKYGSSAHLTSSSLSYPAEHAEAVTPSDATDLTIASRALYVGATGNLSVIMLSGVTVSFVGVPAGALLPLRVSRVRATGTTASSIVAIS